MTTTQTDTIVVRQGLNSDRLTYVPLVGEPVYAIDTKLFYIGDGVTSGGNLVGSGQVLSFVRQTGNFTGIIGSTNGVDTTHGNVTGILPSGVNDGDWLKVFDVAKRWSASGTCVIGTSGNKFIDYANPTPTAGPYIISGVPFVGQGIITFVWDSYITGWSVN